MDREPVLVASIVAAVMSGLAMAVALGWLSLSNEQMDSIAKFLAAALAVGGPIATAIWARTRTTPLADPRDEDGEVLVRRSGGPALRSIRPVQGR